MSIYIKQKRFILILILTATAIITFAGIALLFISQQKIALGSRYIYTEKSGLSYSLNEAEKAQIAHYLSFTYHENESLAGFGYNRQSQPDIFRRLYFNARMAHLTGLDQDLNYQKLFERVFNSYENLLNTWDIPGYELFYYSCLRAQRGLSLDETIISDQLQYATDPATGLLFYRHENDDIGTKLLLTAKVLRLAKRHLINIQSLNYNEAIAHQFEDYPFGNPQSGKTFYNAGGSLLYAAGSASDLAKAIMSCRSWFKSWSEVYAERQISDLTSLIDVSSYESVASLYDQQPSNKLKQYLANLQIADISADSTQKLDSEIICDYILEPGIDLINSTLINFFQQQALSEIQDLNNELSSCDNINLGDTYYGAQLAFLSGFQWNQPKVTQTVCRSYQALQNDLTDREMIFNTYYYVLYLDSFARDYLTDLDREALSRQLDDIMERLLEDIEKTDVTELRVALEIKSGLASYVRQSHLHKIEALIRSYAFHPVSHIKAIDVFKIDKIVNLNILTENLFSQLEESLACDGGYSATVGDEADLATTFRIYSMTTNHDLFDPDSTQVIALKKFLNHLYKDGLYCYRADADLLDYRSILYGYMLRDFTGEQKND